MENLQIMGKILILDCESTGISNHPIHKHPQAIEVAYLDVTDVDISTLSSLDKEIIPKYEERFFPSMEIHIEASKIHGLYKKDLFGCRKSEEIVIPETKYIIGHNIAYDVRALNIKERNTICTLALVKVLDKNLKLGFANHKLDTLIKHYYPDEYTKIISKHHQALGDVYKTYLLLIKLLENLPHIKTWNELYEFQQSVKKPIKVKKEKI